MFEAFFTSAKALARHREGPAAVARAEYLDHCAGYGAAHATLLRIARELLVIAERIEIASDRVVTRQDIELAARCWARYQRSRGRIHGSRWSRELFIQVATAWLRFLGCLEEPLIRAGAFAEQVEEFALYLRDERGLSPKTVYNRRWHVERFSKSLPPVESKDTLAHVTIDDLDNFLSQLGKQGWCRVSIAASAAALRSFFGHAEVRGWCRLGIAAAIDAPKLFKQEGLPSGPVWDDVQRLIASAGGPGPRDLRDRAILILFAVYGLRSGEVSRLRLEDLDWLREVMAVERPKQRRTQHYPLVAAAGDAILQYLQQARPRCARRELFLTLSAPFRPLSPGCMYNLVSRRLGPLDIQVPRRGPHCLRHACAGQLVAAGLSLKEIGDHLGHRSAYSTRIYAKVDLAGLREVADIDLRGLS
jgi:integrase/recombinase XerD